MAVAASTDGIALVEIDVWRRSDPTEEISFNFLQSRRPAVFSVSKRFPKTKALMQPKRPKIQCEWIEFSAAEIAEYQ